MNSPRGSRICEVYLELWYEITKQLNNFDLFSLVGMSRHLYNMLQPIIRQKLNITIGDMVLDTINKHPDLVPQSR